MAHSDPPSHNVTDEYAKLSLNDENEEVLDYEEVGGTEETSMDFKFCWIGRFLTDRSIHSPTMKNMLSSLWKPVKGICIKDLGKNLFLFQFFHEWDFDRVAKQGPWTFNRQPLITERLRGGMNPMSVPLFHLEI